MERIDCHVLLDERRQAQAETLLAQLKREPINLYTAPARPQQTTAARIDALRQGSAPYVCWVDDDDSVTPGVFGALAEALDANPNACGVFSTEAHVHDGRVYQLRPHAGERWTVRGMIDQHPLVHHVALFRRRNLHRYLAEIEAFPQVGDQLLLWLQAEVGPWIHVPIIGYHWRRWAGQLTASVEVRDELDAAKRYARRRLNLI